MREEEKIKQEIIELTKKYYEAKYAKKNTSFQPGDRIPYSGRVFDEKELVNLVDSALEFWLTAGHYAKEFEERLAGFLKLKYCSLVNSGSSANLVAFMALTSIELGEQRIKKGDEVITVAAGFPTTITPIVQYGAIPVFIDVSIPQYNINTDLLEDALSEKTKAVILAHTLGNPFDVQTIRDFCDAHGLWLIEDNCDALGSKVIYNGEWRLTGTIGHISTYSFYPPHHITLGEGGAVCTNDQLLNRLVLSYRDWGRDCWCGPGVDDTCKHRYSQQFGQLPFGYDHKYVYSHFGYNLKITDMQASVGCAQIDKLSDFIEKRKKNWEYLRRGLSGFSRYFIFPEPMENSEPSWFGFLLSIKENIGFSRDEMVGFLENNQIQTRNLFAGNYIKQPCFDELRNSGQGFRIVGELKNTDYIMSNSFWLGVYPGMTEDKLNFIIRKIQEFIETR